MAYIEEILEHARQQQDGDNLVAVGGMHTNEAISTCINLILDGEFPGLTEVPQQWLNWPVQGFFFRIL